MKPAGPIRRAITDVADRWFGDFAARFDGFKNAITGAGTVTYDKRLGASYQAPALGHAEEEELWRGNPLAARVVETWPNEMLRQGWRLSVRGDRREDAREVSEQVEAHLQEVGLDRGLWQALAYRRAYGGGALVLGVRDFGGLTTPLRLDRVRSFDWINVFDAQEIRPRFWYNDPRRPKFGQVEFYEISTHAPGLSRDGSGPPPSFLIHESRVVPFDGVRTSRRRPTMTGWGQSALDRVYAALRDLELGFDSAALLLQDFAQAVYKIEGLADAVTEDQDEQIKARIKAIELARSVTRSVIIDADEDFGRQQTPVTGMPELLDRLATVFAAAADMPLTLLMGQSPAGLNATGESDIRFFYDRVKAQQALELRPCIERIVQITFRALQIPEPDQWLVEFNPLWQPSEKEQAEARKVQAETDQIYVEMMALSPEDVATSRWGSGHGHSFETQVDLDERRRMEEEAKEAERLAQEQSIKSAEAARGSAPAEDLPSSGEDE